MRTHSLWETYAENKVAVAVVELAKLAVRDWDQLKVLDSPDPQPPLRILLTCTDKKDEREYGEGLRCFANTRARVVPGSFESAFLLVMVEIQFRAKVGQVGIFEFCTMKNEYMTCVSRAARAFILTPG